MAWHVRRAIRQSCRALEGSGDLESSASLCANGHARLSTRLLWHRPTGNLAALGPRHHAQHHREKLGAPREPNQIRGLGPVQWGDGLEGITETTPEPAIHARELHGGRDQKLSNSVATRSKGQVTTTKMRAFSGCNGGRAPAPRHPHAATRSLQAGSGRLRGSDFPGSRSAHSRCS